MSTKDFKSKYQLLNLLGQGAFGQVYRVRPIQESKSKPQLFYVAKKMLLQGLNEDQLKLAFGEIQILEKINREISFEEIPSIIAYKEFFKTENELIIVMEFCQSGDLSTLLKKLKASNQRLSERIIVFWFIEMLLGIQALHSKKILHRDLKSANVFLTHDFHVKIGDFGISKILEKSTAITCVGSPLYLSPEVCNNEPYGLSSDIWSLGCILYEMCTLNYPFKASSLIVLATMITNNEVPPLPNHYSKELNNIVQKMFIKDRKKRITLDEILKIPYIAKSIQDWKAFKGDFSELAEPINTAPQIQTIDDTFNDEDTMKTINSFVEKTSQKELLGSQSSKKQKETTQKIKQLQSASQKYSQKTTGQSTAFSKTGLKKQPTNQKIQSETQIKSETMGKIQTINIKNLSNQIQSLRVIDNEDEFEEVTAPSTKPTKTSTQIIKKAASIPQRTSQKKESLVQQSSKKTAQRKSLEQYEADFQEYSE